MIGLIFLSMLSIIEKMKLPFNLPGSGGGNSYHSYNDAAYDHEDLLEFDSQDDFGNEGAEHIFDDYMWMENEEEFDKTEMQRLEEEELIKQCMEENEDDEDEWLEQYE